MTSLATSGRLQIALQCVDIELCSVRNFSIAVQPILERLTLLKRATKVCLVSCVEIVGHLALGIDSVVKIELRE